MTVEKIVQLRKLKEEYHQELNKLCEEMNSKENKSKILKKYINEFFKNYEISLTSIHGPHDYEKLLGVSGNVTSPHFEIKKIELYEYRVFDISISFGLEFHPIPKVEDDKINLKKHRYVFPKNSKIWLNFNSGDTSILNEDISHTLIWEWDEIIKYLKNEFLGYILYQEYDDNNYDSKFNIPKKYCISILNKKPKYKELREFWDEI